MIAGFVNVLAGMFQTVKCMITSRSGYGRGGEL